MPPTAAITHAAARTAAAVCSGVHQCRLLHSVVTSTTGLRALSSSTTFPSQPTQSASRNSANDMDNSMSALAQGSKIGEAVRKELAMRVRGNGEGGGGGGGGGSKTEVSSRLKSLIEQYSSNAGEDDKSKEFEPTREAKVDRWGRSYGTGRRKASVARVWLNPGEGDFMVNGKAMIDYFDRDCHKDDVLLPLQVTQKLGLLNVRCTVEGGGNTGQAGAVRLGIARALEAHDPYLRPPLKNAGLLTRDARVVERKKPGKKKARKSFQWVKR